MKYSQARWGRVFVIRLEQGEVLHEKVEEVARLEGVQAGVVIAIGGADEGSRLVVGPRDGTERPLNIMTQVLSGVHEIAGVGTLFPDKGGWPLVHIHAANGRGEATITGCIRRGVKTWQTMEVILMELSGSRAQRIADEALGFNVLEP